MKFDLVNVPSFKQPGDKSLHERSDVPAYRITFCFQHSDDAEQFLGFLARLRLASPPAVFRASFYTDHRGRRVFIGAGLVVTLVAEHEGRAYEIACDQDGMPLAQVMAIGLHNWTYEVERFGGRRVDWIPG